MIKMNDTTIIAGAVGFGAILGAAIAFFVEFNRYRKLSKIKMHIKEIEELIDETSRLIEELEEDIKPKK